MMGRKPRWKSGSLKTPLRPPQPSKEKCILHTSIDQEVEGNSTRRALATSCVITNGVVDVEELLCFGSSQGSATRLQQLAADVRLGIDQEDAAQMSRFLRATLKGRAAIDLGSACSGSGIDAVAVRDWLVALAPEVSVSVKFAAECCRWKQAWLAESGCPDTEGLRPKFLFADVADLSKTSPKTIAGQRVAPNDLVVDFFFAGFSCKSVSLLNCQRPDFKACVQRSEGQTGKTLRGVLQFIQRSTPAFVFLENVRGFVSCWGGNDGQSSNFGLLQKRLRSLGYFVVYRVTSPEDAGFPQSRPRLWCSGVHCKVVGMSSVRDCSSFVYGSAFDKMWLKTQIPAAQCHNFLFTSSALKWNSNLLRTSSKASVRRTKCSTKTARCKNKFHSKHSKLYRAAQLPYPPQLSNRLVSAVRAAGLTEREVGVLVYMLHTRASGIRQAHEEFFIDLSQSIDRASCKGDVTPCICPGSRVWCVKRKRLLSGVESLMLHGFDFEMVARASALVPFNRKGCSSNSKLKDLAGNAFNAGVLMRCLFSALLGASTTYTTVATDQDLTCSG